MHASLPKSGRPLRLWPIVVFAGLALFVYRLAILLHSTFGDIGVEQIVYHLASPSVGVPTRLIKEALRELFVKPVTLAILLYLLLLLIRRFKSFFTTLKHIIHVGAWVILSLGSYNLYNVTGLGGYIQDRSVQFGKDFDWFASYYSRPVVSIDDKTEKLNLVWIYVESLETRRTQLEPFKHHPIYRVNTVQRFENLPGTGWTMGGMVASQCGLPLMPVGLLSGNGLGDADYFLPKTVCLGDILKKQNYAIEFIGGGDTAFAGTKKFLDTHGFDAVIGRQEIHNITGQDYPADFWGYTDERVLELALQRTSALHQAGRPFFLSVQTLDTHGPNGYLSASCKQQGWRDDIDGIFGCAMSQVGRFVDKLYKSGVQKNTVVVVSGDHPFMGKPTSRLFSANQKIDRSVFFSVLRPDRVVLDVAVMNHFDMFPTVLSALKFKTENHSAGLGRNLYVRNSLSHDEPPGLLAKALRQPSDTYLSQWTP